MLSRAQARTTEKYRDVDGALVMCAISGAAAAFVAAKVIDLTGIFPQAFFTHVTGLVTNPTDYLNFAANHKVKILALYALPIISTTAAVIGAWAFFGRLIDPVLHLRGRKLLRGKEALKSARRAQKIAIENGAGKGLKIVDDIYLSKDNEVRSILVVGNQGGGKTVFINSTLQECFRLGYKCMIFDPVKSDFSGWVPMPGGVLMLISTTDSRSCHWFLGMDIITISDAEAFSEGLIEGGGDNPMWSNSARMVLTSILIKLQKDLGENWSWQELAELAYLPLTELKEIAENYYPPALAAVADAESKTSQSVMINLHAYLSPIFRLAQTWGRIKGKRLSLTKWLNNDHTKHRNIIIQMDQRDKGLGAAVGRMIVNLMTSRIASLEFTASKTRRVLFSLDEIPQFNRLEGIDKLMSIGRSKGIFTIFGFQSIDQIRQIYPQHEDQKWMALFGLRVFPQVMGSDSQSWVCSEIGDREVQFRSSNSSSAGDGNANVSQGWSAPTTIPVMLPSELELLGKRKDGIETLFLGLGANALILKIPFPNCPDIRTPFVPWPSVDKKKPSEIAIAKEPLQSTKSESVDERTNDFLATDNKNNLARAIAAAPKDTQIDTIKQNIPFNFAVNETQKPTEIEEKADDAMEEIGGEMAQNAMVHAVSESFGVPSILLDMLVNLKDLQAPETSAGENPQVSMSVKKQGRKQRKYLDHEA